MSFVNGTVITAAIAIILSVRVSVAMPAADRGGAAAVGPPIVYVVDLLAVVPSVVGLWGILVFAPWLFHIYTSIARA